MKQAQLFEPCSCSICKEGRCGICKGALQDFTITKHQLITSEMDILALDIVNWNHLNGYWSNVAEALHTISSWFINCAHVTIIQADLRQAPKRDDFPGWEHVGHHADIGKLFWNWFHDTHNGELTFSDSPDFYGTLQWADGTSNSFWGDIGKCSPLALAAIQKQMSAGDIWINVHETSQIIIEPFIDLFEVPLFEEPQ